jgi:3-keto-disaccharide hydrolase
MKKDRTVLAFIFVLLIACNFPFMGNSNTENEVATQVAAAKTSTAIQENVTATPPLPTIAPTSSSTHSEPASPSPSPSPEPSLTATPADFAAQLGAPTYSNPMNNGTAFGIDASGYDDGHTRIIMSDGAMVLSSYSTNGWRGWRLTDRGMSNFYMEGSFTTVTCSGKDQYGLVFRSPDYATGEGYYFGITCDGNYSLLLSDGNQYHKLIDSSFSDQIKPGSNQANRLGVLAEGPKISLFINGAKVNETSNSAYQTDTKVGVFILGLNTPGFTVKLDQFNMWSR